jgi:glycosyltransferase 2 family protein
VAVVASLVPFLLLFAFTPVSPKDVFSVGIVPFVMSVGAVMVRVLLQAYRFRYFIKHFIGPHLSSTGKIMVARLAGEFVTQTTPSYVGGEIVRIAWLTKNGVPAGQAAWVATTEIISDVFVGSTLAFIAGGLALLHGGTFIGTIVILVAIPTFTFWLLVVILSAKRNIQLPRIALKLMQKFLSEERSLHIANTTNTALADLCKMSREHFNSRESVKVFVIGIAMTFVAFLFQGVSFLVLANAVHEHVGLLESFMATSASTALSTLPITIGGSGLAELGIWAYISNLNGLPHIADILKDSQLSVIIAWRIATYHIPLVVMWIALMKLTLGKKLLAVKLNGNSTATTDNNNKDESNGKIKSGKEKNLYSEKKNSTLEINSSDSNINLGKQGHSNFSSSPDTLNSAPSTFSRSKGTSHNSGTDPDSKSEEQVDSEKNE